ncbi:MAG: nicotinate phosphoribosyltransferase [Deltaproteobacteria bacterium]|nr:nicotinate phosphoribosyltransferase [Deltaproteobacteria bacterium]RLA89399.1 MAG: nicotinate phosphoribosyltransferase [Deltaproteobacteria bacterium]
MKLRFRNPKTGEMMDNLEVVVEDKERRFIDMISSDKLFDMLKHLNHTLDTDFYEIRMAAGFWAINKGSQKAVFDLYYRKNPFGGGFAICAGLEQVVEYLMNLKFYHDDIEYLRELGEFSEPQLRFLQKEFRFTGDLYAIPEGTIVFPNIPILKVIADLPQAQFIETALLSIIGHQTLIATKAARINIAAKGDPVVDFGLRRAHGIEAGLYGARATYIGGCIGTSNTKAAKKFDIPAIGTHAHSWVESHRTELEAFKNFAKLYPKNCVLLVDTYDTLKSGVPNAIMVAKEMERVGERLLAIRLDSGDLAYYSKNARILLDKAGLNYVKISASNDLDEYLIQDLKIQGAKIDMWGVGTKMITAYQQPALGQVYKLMAVDEDGLKLRPKIKISDDMEKVTNPGNKRVIRFYNRQGYMIGDVFFLEEEDIPKGKFRVYHPNLKQLNRELDARFGYEELLVPIIKKGKVVYDFPSLHAIRERTKEQLSRLEDEHKRLPNPHIYKVSLSEKLFDLKHELIMKHLHK